MTVDISTSYIDTEQAALILATTPLEITNYLRLGVLKGEKRGKSAIWRVDQQSVEELDAFLKR